MFTNGMPAIVPAIYAFLNVAAVACLLSSDAVARRYHARTLSPWPVTVHASRQGA
jgi:hypothetical protein